MSGRNLITASIVRKYPAAVDPEYTQAIVQNFPLAHATDIFILKNKILIDQARLATHRFSVYPMLLCYLLRFMACCLDQLPKALDILG